jgi:DNA-binding MarR family transcriptional regulator
VQRPTEPRVTQGDVIESVLAASRALVAVAARSLAAAGEDITLPQYRVLILIARRGPQRALDLAEALDVSQSTITRMCDRLGRKGLVDRERPADNRRTVITTITPSGRHLVDAVIRRRRREISAILAKMTPRAQEALVPALHAFAAAAGEAPEQSWSLGWSTGD